MVISVRTLSQLLSMTHQERVGKMGMPERDFIVQTGMMKSFLFSSLCKVIFLLGGLQAHLVSEVVPGEFSAENCPSFID